MPHELPAQYRVTQPDHRADVPEQWADQAACAETSPDMFFPNSQTTYPRDAIKVCQSCPVIQQCLEYALRTKQQDGVWGGMVPRQRMKLRTAERKGLYS